MRASGDTAGPDNRPPPKMPLRSCGLFDREDPGPMGLYLGCVHKEGAVEMDDGRKIRTVIMKPEEPRDSGGANGSEGPAESTPESMPAAAHTGDGSWGVRYFVQGKAGRKPSIVYFRHLMRVAPEDSDPSQWAQSPPP
jgi:hypothetical protein